MKKIYLNCLFIICMSLQAYTQEIKIGDLDKNFGNLGVVDLSSPFTIGDITYYPGSASATTVQTDGKILAGAVANGTNATKGFVLFRLNADGTLDNSFGNGGRAFVEITGAVDVTCIAIQSNGKILLGGNAPFHNGVVVRFNQDGSIDNTFSGDGIFQIDYTTTYGGSCNTIGIQSTGKIIFAGETSRGIFLMRLNADGTPDISFKNTNDYLGGTTTGIIVLPVSYLLYFYFDYFNIANSIAIQQNDNKIVVTGNTGPFQTTFVLRLNADGSSEINFGGEPSGIRTFDVITGGGRSYSTGHVVKIQSFNGPLVIVGSSYSEVTNAFKYFVIRLLNTGFNDNSFGEGGLKIIDHVARYRNDPIPGPGSPPVPSFVIEPSNGKFLISGSTPDMVDPYHSSLAIYRLKTDGSMDDCFGENGILSFADYIPCDSRYSLALQPNGQAIALAIGSPALFFKSKALRLVLNGLAIKIGDPVSNSSFTQKWTWIKGNNTVDALPVNGTQGVSDPANNPGGLYFFFSWQTNDGKLWVFGGQETVTSTSFGRKNKLWNYNPVSNQWTWVKGNNPPNQFGIYGTKGISDVANNPGSRTSGSSWKDNEGNLWLFGGNGNAASAAIGRLNDLWRYNTTNNEWTWVSGTNSLNQYGVYGTKGIPDAANNPGSRSVAVSWTDAEGNFWLYGGFGFGASGLSGYLNDLWKYNPQSNLWTWINGSSTVYQPDYFVAKGVADLSNMPGGRQIAFGWYANGDFYLMGGTGYNQCSDPGFLNDLWKYNQATNTWTYLKGDNKPYWPGNYGTQGVSASSNQPGGRNGSVTVIDKAGRLLMFGGQGSAYDGQIDNLNDLWKYDPASNNWTWLGGGYSIVQVGVYGTQGVPNAANKPGQRSIGAGFCNSKGELILFGGSGYGFDKSGVLFMLNDLWSLSPYITLACPSNTTATTVLNQCSVAVNNIDPVLTPVDAVATINYTLTGATTGNGTGSVSGMLFNTGVTTVTYTLADDLSQTCSFTVTVSYPVTPTMNITTSDVTNNLCNGILLTANSNVPVQSYSWSNGVTTQSNFLTTANASGTYTVNAVSESGCPAIPSANFLYDKQAVTSSYTLLATNSIKLQQNNTVVNGSVGVVNASGNVSLKKNVSINGTGAFLKAQSISLQAPYTIPTIFYAPASITLPTMQYNTTSTSGLANATVPNGTTTTFSGNFKNVTIGSNCNVTLTGSIFGAITIGSGSKVNFSQSSIDITAITMNAGTVSANTQLKFSGDAIVRCAGSILVNTRSIVNPDNYKVIIYLGKTSGAPVAFTASAGGNETVNASMYIPSGKISVGGDAINMTYMNGKFIAENIETLDKNVIWNWYDCTPAAAAPLITSKTSNTIKEQPSKPVIGLKVKAWPNPSEHQFTINVESNSNEKIELRVYDMYGRVVYSSTGISNKQCQFGNRFVRGTYIAEVRQGINRSTVKLIKQ